MQAYRVEGVRILLLCLGYFDLVSCYTGNFRLKHQYE